ncbi:MAG: head maturation protease, ClpP-related [Oscillospiraceae bacterium]
MKKFWNWKNRTVTNEETQEQIQERTLFLNGTIAEESWFDDDVTPQLFKDELMSGSGNITVWINSPGGDCVAAAQIYNMLMDYHGDVTVKIDGIAASAASVIAMAGTKVLMSPTALMMIHNPLTVAIGDSEEMQKAIDMSSIQNAYQGFAKQNYTMLDNLKLGYGGTKQEMERLLADAEKISGVKYDISSYADVVEAIHVMQESMDIAGTTAKEAEATISGSVNALKSAVSNLIVSLLTPTMRSISATASSPAIWTLRSN